MAFDNLYDDIADKSFGRKLFQVDLAPSPTQRDESHREHTS